MYSQDKPLNHPAQLYLEDLERLPIGVSLNVYLSNGNIEKNIEFNGIVVKDGVAYFKKSHMPFGSEVYKYGATPNGNKWEQALWLVPSDEDFVAFILRKRGSK